MMPYAIFRLLWVLFKNLRSLARFYRSFPGVTLELPAKISSDDHTAISIGSGVSIGPYSEIVVMKHTNYSRVTGALRIGDRVVIGAFCNIRAAGGEVVIGRDTILAQHVSLVAANHLAAKDRIYRDLPWDETRVGVSLGVNVWIGSGAVILPGVSIGNNSIVGAGAVVTRSIPCDEIWAGIPARKIRSI